MKYTKLFLILMLTFVTYGCASQEEIQTLADANVAMVQAQSARTILPTLTVKCGDSADACKGLDLKFIHPKDRQPITFQRIHSTNDVIMTTIPTAFSAVKWVAGFWAAQEIVEQITDSAGGYNTNVSNVNTTNGDGNTTQVTNDMATTNSTTSSMVGDTSTSETNQQDNSVVTNTSIADSQNQQDNNSITDSQNQQDDNSIGLTDSLNPTDSFNSTAEPFYVTPVIVQPLP